MRDRLPHHPADACARVERRKRILEDHLHAPANRPQLALGQVRDVLSVEDDPPFGRLVEADERASDRRLAAARLADETERLAALDRERDPVHGLDVADVAVEDEAALDREVDLQPVDLDQRARPGGVAHAVTADRVRSHSSSATGLKHAT